jgi:hypothetical protein
MAAMAWIQMEFYLLKRKPALATEARFPSRRLQINRYEYRRSPAKRYYAAAK